MCFRFNFLLLNKVCRIKKSNQIKVKLLLTLCFCEYTVNHETGLNDTVEYVLQKVYVAWVWSQEEEFN